MANITPFLWFDGKAEEAAEFYCSIFEDSKVLDIARYSEAGPGAPGSVMTVSFRLRGQDFIALNGGPDFTFNEAISFCADCESQEQLDEIWGRLLEGGGQEVQCGWLKDRYGLSWQVVPADLGDMLTNGTPEQRARVSTAVYGMVKLDIAALRRAYEGS